MLHRPELEWIGIATSLLMFLGYEARLRHLGRKQPGRVARFAHARLRAEWVEALARHPGSELLAVQTLRNSLMSATVIASTWCLCLMGLLGIISRSPVPGDFAVALTPRVVVTALLVTALFASVVVALIAIRFFNHAGFIISLPVGSAQRTAATPLAVEYVRRGGDFYSWSLRSFFGVAPLVVGALIPAAMPLPAVGMILALSAFDRAVRPQEEIAR